MSRNPFGIFYLWLQMLDHQPDKAKRLILVLHSLMFRSKFWLAPGSAPSRHYWALNHQRATAEQIQIILRCFLSRGFVRTPNFLHTDADFQLLCQIILMQIQQDQDLWECSSVLKRKTVHVLLCQHLNQSCIIGKIIRVVQCVVRNPNVSTARCRLSSLRFVKAALSSPHRHYSVSRPPVSRWYRCPLAFFFHLFSRTCPTSTHQFLLTQLLRLLLVRQ